jgi:hypothetical protein
LRRHTRRRAPIYGVALTVSGKRRVTSEKLMF